jgi:hypothetical protein
MAGTRSALINHQGHVNELWPVDGILPIAPSGTASLIIIIILYDSPWQTKKKEIHLPTVCPFSP